MKLSLTFLLILILCGCYKRDPPPPDEPEPPVKRSELVVKFPPNFVHSRNDSTILILLTEKSHDNLFLEFQLNELNQPQLITKTDKIVFASTVTLEEAKTQYTVDYAHHQGSYYCLLVDNRLCQYRDSARIGNDDIDTVHTNFTTNGSILLVTAQWSILNTELNDSECFIAEIDDSLTDDEVKKAMATYPDDFNPKWIYKANSAYVANRHGIPRKGRCYFPDIAPNKRWLIWFEHDLFKDRMRGDNWFQVVSLKNKEYMKEIYLVALD